MHLPLERIGCDKVIRLSNMGNRRGLTEAFSVHGVHASACHGIENCVYGIRDGGNDNKCAAVVAASVRPPPLPPIYGASEFTDGAQRFAVQDKIPSVICLLPAAARQETGRRWS